MASTIPDDIDPIKITSITHQFKFNYSKTKDLLIGKALNSPIFTAGNHDWTVIYYPQGARKEDNGLYISLYLTLRSDSKDVTVTFDFTLLTKDGRPSSQLVEKTLHIFPCRNKSWGFPQFMRQTELEAQYIKDNCFVLVCSMTVVTSPCTEIPRYCTYGVPPYDLHGNLGKLLEGGEMTDVSFDVDGERFPAHRLILAARSPVFKAELFGQMAETSMHCIKIKDMQAVVFKGLLHFIYTDSFPKTKDLTGDESGDGKNTSTAITQHLLAAADRYAIEGLKVICSEKLCKSVTIDTVMDNLALAERHNCPRLKDVCLDFAALPENFLHLTFTDEYLNLMRSFPSLMSELRSRISQTSVFKDILRKPST